MLFHRRRRAYHPGAQTPLRHDHPLVASLAMVFAPGLGFQAELKHGVGMYSRYESSLSGHNELGPAWQADPNTSNFPWLRFGKVWPAHAMITRDIAIIVGGTRIDDANDPDANEIVFSYQYSNDSYTRAINLRLTNNSGIMRTDLYLGGFGERDSDSSNTFWQYGETGVYTFMRLDEAGVTYKNGVHDNTDTARYNSSGDIDFGSGGDVGAIIGNTSQGDTAWRGLVNFVYVCSRALTHSEVQEFSVDPFCIFTPPQLYVYGAELGIAITPSAVSAVQGAVDPALELGSTTASPAAASGVQGAVDPTIELGSVTASPAAISAVQGALDPTVVRGSLTLTPGAASGVQAAVDPSVDIGLTALVPDPVVAVAATTGPAAIYTRDPVTAVADATNPVVVYGSLNLRGRVSAVAAALDPAVVQPIQITKAEAVAGVADPVIHIALALTPSPVSGIAATVDPQVVRGGLSIRGLGVFAVAATTLGAAIQGEITIAPAPGSARGSTSATVIQGPLTLTGVASAVSATVDPGVAVITPGTAVAVTVDPQVVLGAIPVGDIASAVAGAVDPTVSTISPASVAAGAVDPVVIQGNTTASPEPGSVVSGAIDPTVIAGSIAITAPALDVISATIDPAIIAGSLTLKSGLGATTTAGAIDPVVVEGNTTASPDPASVTAGALRGAWVMTSTSASPSPVSGVATGTDPTVIYGALSLAPDSVTGIAAAIDPLIIRGSVSIDPDPASAIQAGADPNIIITSPVSVAPVAGTAIAVAVRGNVYEGQVPGSVVLWVSTYGTITTELDTFGALVVEGTTYGNLTVEIDP